MDSQVKCAKPVLALRGCQCCWWIVCILGAFLRLIPWTNWKYEKKWYQTKDEAYAVCQNMYGSGSCIGTKCFTSQRTEVGFSTGMCSGSSLPIINNVAENDLALATCYQANPDAHWCHVGLYRSGGSWRWHNNAAVTYTNWADEQGDDHWDDSDSAAWLTEKGHDSIKKWIVMITLIGALVTIIFAIVVGVDLCAQYKGLKDNNRCCIICAMSGDITLVVFYCFFVWSAFMSLGGPMADWASLIGSILCLGLLIASMSITCTQCCTWSEGAPQAQTVNGMPVGQPMEVIGGVVK